MRTNIPSPALAAVGFAALAAAQSVVPSASGFNYLECAVEPFDNGLSNTRALHGASMVLLNNMTVEQCGAFCKSGSFNYMGVEYGSECYCGNQLSQGTTLDTSGGCNAPCAGSSAELCGGSGRMNLYSAKGAPDPNLPSTFTPNATASTPLTNWNYVNCAVEPFYVANANTSVRALTGDGTTTSQMTVEYCATYCAGYAYFGVEYTDECYCGNSVDSRTQLESCGKCNSLCAGNTNETCGGPGHLSLYKANNATVPVFAAPSACSSPSSSATATGAGSGSTPTTTGVSCPAANGTVYTSGSQSYTIECGLDRQGSNIYALQTSSFGACLNQCALVPGCNDVSYVGNNCYLKNQINAPSNNSAVSGAVLVGGVSSPPTVYANGASGGTGQSGGGQAYNYLGVVNEPTSTSGSGSGSGTATTNALTVATTTSSQMTLESCATFCTGYSATFFGVENSNTCYCGNTFTNGSTQALGVPTNPIMACKGNSAEQCGGVQELTVYALPGTNSPFDSNGNLLPGAGTGSTSTATITASVSSACNTNSATICGSSATCVSLGASSTCQLTGAATITTTASLSSACDNAATVCGATATCSSTGSSSVCVLATTTAGMSSACNVPSGTVCGTRATCSSINPSSSTCGPTAAGSTQTQSVGQACNPAATSICQAGIATCKSVGAASSTCDYITTTSSAIGASCQAGSGSVGPTVCASASATCNPSGVCAVSTSTQSVAGGTCAPTATPAVACFSGGSCKNGVCAVNTITASANGGSCAPAATPATVCPASANCGSNGQCSITTITASANGGSCAPAATPATVCPSGAACGSNGQCTATNAVTMSLVGGQCFPTLSPTPIVCASTLTCANGRCATYTTSTQSTLGGQCAPSALPATVCQSGAGSCTSAGATSTCAQITATTTAGINSACYTGTASAITSCGAQATCTGGSGNGAGTCAYTTATQTNAGGVCTQPANGAATVCGNGLSCAAKIGASSTCSVMTNTVAYGTACNTAATPAVACPTDATCTGAAGATPTCKYVPPSSPGACNPNVDISTCGTIALPQNKATVTYTTWYTYNGTNNGYYQLVTGNGNTQTVSATNACQAASSCAAFAVSATATDDSFGMVLQTGYVGIFPLAVETCNWVCGRFATKTGPAFAASSTAFYYPFGWTQ